MRRLLLLFVLVSLLPSTAAAAEGYRRSLAAVPDQKPIVSEKESRTPAQRKINPQLLFEIYRRRGQAKEKNVPPAPTGVRIDRQGRAYVDIRAHVTAALEKKIAALGATIASTAPEYRSILAWVPLLKLEQLAEDSAVSTIVPAAEATTVK